MRPYEVVPKGLLTLTKVAAYRNRVRPPCPGNQSRALTKNKSIALGTLTRSMLVSLSESYVRQWRWSGKKKKQKKAKTKHEKKKEK